MSNIWKFRYIAQECFQLHDFLLGKSRLTFAFLDGALDASLSLEPSKQLMYYGETHHLTNDDAHLHNSVPCAG